MSRVEELEGAARVIEEKIKLHLIPSSLLLLPAALCPFIAWFSCFIPEGENPGVWFQRSGSITVMLAVSIEFFLLRIESHINPENNTPSRVWELGETYRYWFNLIQIMAVVLAIIGTVIWGYGDLFKNT